MPTNKKLWQRYSLLLHIFAILFPVAGAHFAETATPSGVPKYICIIRKMEETHHVRMFMSNNSTAYQTDPFPNSRTVNDILVLS